MNEIQLIEGCSKKNQKAQRAFFDKYYPLVFRLARRYLSDYHEAEDVVIIVFNKALKNISHFEYRGEGSLKKWLNICDISLEIWHRVEYSIATLQEPNLLSDCFLIEFYIGEYSYKQT